MIDRENVIKGLEICSEHGSWHGLDCEHNGAYKDCPYRGCETGCVVTIAKDALALLKEQPEQKHGHWIEQDDYNDTYYKCSVCGEPWVLIDGTPSENNMCFCPKCGARMESEVKQE